MVLHQRAQLINILFMKDGGSRVMRRVQDDHHLAFAVDEPFYHGPGDAIIGRIKL